MEIFEAAIALGKMIKDSKEGIELEEAKKEWSECEELRTAYTEYTTQHKLLELQEQAGNPDPALNARITNRANELYNVIINHESYKRLDAAQEALNNLVQQVNGIIIEQITGTNPNCTHDCSTCGGCH